MGSDPQDVHPSSAHLHDEQRVQTRERDRVHVKEIRGQQPAGLGGEKATPLTASRASLRWRSQTGAAQHPADGGGADPVPETVQLPVHAAKSPAGIVDAEPGDELAQVLGDRWASRGRWLSPPAPDQALVPGQQGARGDDPMTPQDTRQQPSQGSQQCPIRPARARCSDLTAQHCHLVPQDQYLDVLGRRGPRQQHQPREDVGGEQVEHPHKHEQ
jgi:hypothetical protein